MRIAAVACVLALFAGLAEAAPTGAGTAAGLFDVQSAFAPPAGVWTVGLSGTLYQVETRREPGSAGDRDVLDGGLQVSAGVGGWLEVFGRFDAAGASNDAGSFLSSRDGLLGAKVALPWHAKWLQAGVSGDVTLPWGRRARGFSSGSFDPGVALLLTVPLPESNGPTAAAVHLNAGYRRRNDDRGRVYEGRPLYYLEPAYPQDDSDRIDLRGAFEFRARSVTIFAEVILDQLVHPEIAFGEGPLFLTPGFRLALADRVSLLLASKVTLAVDTPATTRFRPPEEMFPDWQIGFALTWRSAGPDTDRDGDGVPDFRDRCPQVPEDRDGVADQDGCPEVDHDGDGIPDDRDACPDVPEDMDGDADDDGCPEADAPAEPEGVEHAEPPDGAGDGPGVIGGG